MQTPGPACLSTIFIIVNRTSNLLFVPHPALTKDVKCTRPVILDATSAQVQGHCLLTCPVSCFERHLKPLFCCPILNCVLSSQRPSKEGLPCKLLRRVWRKLANYLGERPKAGTLLFTLKVEVTHAIKWHRAENAVE